MSSSSNQFTVPTLSLSTSRSKRQYGASIPTRDYSYLVTSMMPVNQNDINL